MAGCQVNGAIERALRDGAATYEERGILVLRHLDASVQLATEEPVLDQALYTLFRGLPERLAPGATLLISTRDRSGGDVELTWEARERPPPPGSEALPERALSHGPYGDLLELALHGLEVFCRVRSAVREEPEAQMGNTSTFLTLAPHIRRRYSFLIPSLRRDPVWAPRS